MMHGGGECSDTGFAATREARPAGTDGSSQSPVILYPQCHGRGQGVVVSIAQ